MKRYKYFLLALITLSLSVSEFCAVNFKFTFLSSTAVAQSVSDRKAKADRLFEQGKKQFEASQFQQALQSWEQSLAIYREIGNQQGIANSLNNLGLAYDDLGDYRKAIDYFQQALVIKKQIGNREGIANSLGNLGIAYSNLGNYRKAIDYHQQSLVIKKQIGNREGIANSLGNLGVAYYSVGNYHKAIDYYEQPLAIFKQIGNRKGVANSLMNLGNAYLNLGSYRKAIDYYQQSLIIAKEIGNRKGIANSLMNLGNTYLSLGSYRKAIDYYEQALPIFKQIGNRRGIAKSVMNLGNAYLSLGSYRKAINYYEQSLVINKEIGNRGGIAASLNNLGLAYSNLGNYRKAIDYYEQSLVIKKQIGDRGGIADSVNNLGNAYDDLGDYHKAIDYHQQSLVIKKQIGDRDGIASSLLNLGNAYDNLGDYRKAINYYQQGLAIFKKIGNRFGIAGSLNNLGTTYEKLQEYENAEKKLYQGIAIWEDMRKLLRNQDTWKVSIFEEQASTYRLLQEVLVAQKRPLQALEISERGRTRALVEILWRQLSQKPSEELIPPSPNLAEIQQIAQQQNATLVEYSIVSDNQLYIWVIPPQGKIQFRSANFPKDIKKLVKITRNSIGVRGRNSNNSSVKQKNCTDCLKQLYQLLIDPIAELLPKDEQQRVVFIPHQELFLVPFVALQDENDKYLIEKHTILTAPSIQVLSLSQTNKQPPKNPSVPVLPNGESALIVGNPNMTKGGVGQELEPLKQLPGAEKEANKIAQMLNTKAIIGNQATESAIVQKMASAKLIHLATHGLLDGNNAIGSPGAIALTPDDKNNDSPLPPDDKNDGFLTTSEIMENFGLSGKQKLQADLIVLSACDTGRGEIKGEGVIGLSRAFMASGVPTLVVSVWKVPDDDTVKLMTEFYTNIYEHKFDKAKAMREAMLAMLNEDDGNPDPKAWAAFTVIGKAE